MKKSILIIALVTLSISSFSASLVGKTTRHEGKQYTILFEGKNYTVLIDKEGNRKILSFKKK
tara:strand:+ start:224 stop:409 length:186 start_codon:yes stop_codon:yes gene_type:complete